MEGGKMWMEGLAGSDSLECLAFGEGEGVTRKIWRFLFRLLFVFPACL